MAYRLMFGSTIDRIGNSWAHGLEWPVLATPVSLQRDGTMYILRPQASGLIRRLRASFKFDYLTGKCRSDP
ncbi:MAG: hypothetical protein AAES65_19495 [Candidatus Thiodiazotropha sp. (ex. Lucinoma kazani)]